MSSWDWIHEVTLVAQKVLENHPLGRLMVFISDWEQVDRFPPGAKGGQEYLTTNFFQEKNTSWKVHYINKQYEEISCYLFPAVKDIQNASILQHINSYKKLALYGMSDLEYKKDHLTKSCHLAELMRSLQHPNKYVKHMIDPGHEVRWKSQQQETLIKSAPKKTHLDLEKELLEFQTKRHDNHSDQFLGNFSIDPSLSSSGTSQTLFSVDENSDSLFKVDPVPTTFTISNSPLQEQMPPREEKISFQDFLAKQKTPPIENRSEDPKEESKTSKTQKVSNADGINVCPEEPLPNEISSSETKSSPDEIVARLFGPSRNKLEVSIKIPVISRRQNETEVPPKLTSYTDSETLPQSENYFSRKPEHEDLDSGLSKCNFNNSTDFSSTLPGPSGIFSKLQQPPTRFVDPKEVMEATEMLLTEIVNYLKSLHPQNLFTITVDETISICSRRVPNRIPGSFDLTILQAELIELFRNISQYVEKMDKKFQTILHFVNTKDLYICSRKNIEDIKRYSEIKTGSLQQVFVDKVMLLEEHYIAINEEIRIAESNNSKTAFDLVTKLYINKTSERVSTEEELVTAHEKWSQVAKDAFVQIYGECSEEIIESNLMTLNEELIKLHKKNLGGFKAFKKTENEDIDSLLQLISTRFGSELNRSTLMNASISTEDQFEAISRACRSNAKINFSSQMSSLSLEGQQKLKERVDTEIDLIAQRTLMEFRAKKIVPNVLKKPTVGAASNSNYSNPGSSGYAFQSSSRYSADASENAQHFENKTTNNKAIVGVRFGFDQLCAVALVDGKFRNIYGPTENALVFQEDEVIIGDVSSASTKKLLIKTVLEQHDFSKPVLSGDREYSVCEVLAIVFSQLHCIVSTSLHTSKISYAVAVPSALPTNMMSLMQDALQIAGMEGTVIREACGQLTRFLYGNSGRVTQSTSIITIVENSDNSADAILYESKHGKLTPVKLTGSCVVPGWITGVTLGMSVVIDNLVSCTSSKRSVCCIVECSKQKDERNSQIFQKKASSWDLYFYSKWDATIAEGAALFAGWKYDPTFKQAWDQRYPRFNEENQFTHQEDFKFRLKYKGSRLDSMEIVKMSQRIKQARKEHQEALLRAKEQGKRQCLEAHDNIQTRHDLSKAEEEEMYKKISEITRRIEGETQSITAVRKLISELYV